MKIKFFYQFILLIIMVFNISLSQIVYYSDSTGNHDIYSLNLKSRVHRNLTNHTADDYGPRWSPDGSKIAFTSDRGGDYDIYIMDSTGTGIDTLTRNSPDDEGIASWSPDGTKLTYWVNLGGVGEICMINADGSGYTRLTNNNFSDHYPDWSPDGNWIVYCRPDELGELDDIYVINPVDTSEKYSLTFDAQNNTMPAWSPDGKKIAYLSTRNGNLWRDQIWIADFSTPGGIPTFSNHINITDNQYRHQSPRWSPDGTKILCGRCDYNTWETIIGYYDLAEVDTPFIPLTTNPRDRFPDWRWGLERGLVAYYPFNGNANDESGNGNDGTVNDAILTTDRFDHADSAYSFDGIDDYIKVPYNENLYPSSLTISLWINIHSISTTHRYLLSNSGSGATPPYDPLHILCPMDNLHTIRYGLEGNNNASVINLFGEFILRKNLWYHISGTYDEVTGKAILYINGVSQDSSTSIMTLDQNNLGLIIGARQTPSGNADGPYFHGSIDDIRYYNRALNKDEINALYHEDGWNGPTEFGTLTDIDGNIYQTIKIGNQWWMAENLKVTCYQNGDPIPNVTDNGEWAGRTTSAYCNYNNSIDSVATYGRLYNWHTVDDIRNIAPEGWHVPTDEEWKQLEIYLGMNQSDADAIGWRGTDEGGKLKESGIVHWTNPNTGATNESGFTALPGGYRNDNGIYDGVGISSFFWTATDTNNSYPIWYRILNYDHSNVQRELNYKENGYSIRCIKNYVQTKNLSTPDTSGGKNDLITIPVQVLNPDSIAGVEFTLDFDPDILTAQSVAKTALTSDFTLTDSINNTIGRIACVLTNETAIQSSDPGSIVDITFQVNSGVSAGDTCSLILNNVLLADENSIPIDADISNGLFTVTMTLSPVRMELSSVSDTLLINDTLTVHATGYNEMDSVIAISPDWSVTGNIGTVNPATGNSTSFIATNQGTGTIIASLDTLTESVSVLVCKKGNLFNSADTTLDVRDAVFCLRIVAGLINASPIQERIADMNNDQTVDVADVLLIMFEAVKRLMSAKTVIFAKTAQTGNANVHITSLKKDVKGNHDIPVTIDGRSDIYAASITLTYDSSEVEIIDITPAMPSALIAANTGISGQVKVALVDLKGLINESHELIKIQIKAKKDKISDFTIKQIKLYDANANAIKIENLTNLNDQKVHIPKKFSLHQNYPNPFNPLTTIRYDLPEDSKVNIEIYNILGVKVRTLINGISEAGSHTKIWDARNDNGIKVSTGMYIYRMKAIDKNKKSFVDVKKMLLLK